VKENIMHRTLALVLVVALTVPACAAARATTSSPLVVPPASDPVISTFVRSLPPGSRVRIEVASGRTLRGTLLQATENTVTVQRHTRVPEAPVAIPIRDVQRVTIDLAASNSRGMAIGAAIGAGAAIGVLWLIAVFGIDD
jgi:hypothetical protein